MHVTVKNATLLFQFVRLVHKADCFCLAFYFKLREHSGGTFFMTHDLIAKGFFKFDSLTDSQSWYLFFFTGNKYKNLIILK